MKHTFMIHTYYEDTDASGIVYHANYLKFAERARTEFLHHIGFTHNQLLDADSMLVVSRIEVDYKKPAFCEDELCVTTQVEKLGAAMVVLSQVITKKEIPICQLKVYVALISKSSLRPIRISPELRSALESYNNN